jgi:hypothetical protein
MVPYISASDGSYYEASDGIALHPADTPVPRRPDQYYTWTAGAWAAFTPVPQTVSRFQALAALQQQGLLDKAQAAVTAAGGVTLLAWNNAQSFERNSPTIAALAAALNLTSAQVDALFVSAAQISA